MIKVSGTPPDVSVVAPARDVADARLHRLVDALVAAGLRVEVLGTGSAADAPRGVVAVNMGARSNRLERALHAVTVPLLARGKVLLVLDPDAVPAAWLRARVRRQRLVVDLSEDYATLLRDRDWATGIFGAAARKVADAAVALAARADLTVVADEHVPPATARQRFVVRNLPAGDYLPSASGPDLVPRAIYIGDLRRSRGLFDMIDAVAAAPDWLLDLVGPVAENDAAELATRLANSSVVNRIRVHGRRPPKEAWALARGAWVGLSLLHDTPAFRVAMPSKVYEYLASGLAVVASPLPRQAELVRSTGAGVVVTDPETAAAALRRYSSDPGLLASHRAAALTAAQKFDGARVHDEFAAAVAQLLAPA